jgi:hypothetical protein
MNKSWLLLIVAGLGFLFAVIGWEAYQNFSGARSNIDLSLIEYQRDSLFNPTLEKHLSSDSRYINQLSQQSSSESGEFEFSITPE